MGASESKKSINFALIASVVVASATIGAVYFYTHKGKSQERKSNNSTSVTTAPSIPKAQLVEILNEICSKMNEVVIQLAQIEAKIRQDSQSNGQEIPEEALGKYLLNQFEENMRVVESQVYAKYQCTEGDVQSAAEYFTEEADEEVGAAVSKLKQLFSIITGQSDTEPAPIPDDFTVEKLLQVMEETMEAMSAVMEETCQEINENPLPEGKSIHTEINQMYIRRADEVTAEIHKSHGVSRGVIQSAMMKYQQDKMFLQRMASLQNIQAERFKQAAATLGDQLHNPASA